MTMTVASGTSTPTSITVVATSTSMSAGPELGHDPLLLGRGQLAVEEADPQAGQLRLGQSLGLGHHRGGLDPVRSLDQRAHHEGPVPGRDLLAHPLPRLVRLLRGPQPRRGHRQPARGQLVDDGHVQVAEDHHGRGAGNGRGRHHQQIGIVTGAVAPRPLARRAARCSTPNRCCSSMTTTPRERNATWSVRRAWVPMSTSTVPSASPAWMSARSPRPSCW